MAVKVKPGQKCPVSGQYKVGKSKTEVTIVKDKTVPPTKSGGQYYTLVDKTIHKK